MRRSLQEIGEVGEAMGTWDAGPFDSDETADFAGELDDAPAQARIEMIGTVLERVADPADDDSRLSDAPRAVAAAALIAAQCPGGAPIDPNYGPSTPMPQFPAYLRDLAVKALDSVITKPTWLVAAWDESPSGPEWRRTISELRAILDPPQEETLFPL
jgi:Domain of unknown function (DUF4259)